jgi:carbon monoxide dehydrogenase subunit G
MEVELKKRYPLAVSSDRAWAVLTDIRAVAGCMPGAQITEQIDATHYKGLVKSKVGPAVMSFTGDIEVLDLVETERRLELLGKGADKGGSSAAMKLLARLEPGEGGVDTCVLLGDATVTVSGKLAQFGGRLLVPIADAMLAQFAKNFETAAAAVEVAAAPAPVAAVEAEPLAAPVAAPAMARADAPTSTVILPQPRPPVPIAAPANELNALGLMWAVIRGWFLGLLGKKTA